MLTIDAKLECDKCCNHCTLSKMGGSTQSEIKAKARSKGWSFTTVPNVGEVHLCSICSHRVREFAKGDA